MTIPKKMRAAILVEQKKPLVIDVVDLPEELDVGQVLVKVHFSGICGSQLGEIDGAKGEDKFLPHLLGHEASGTVLDVGAGVKHVRIGDRVVMHWRKGLGIESSPPSYLWQGGKLNAGWIATFNEYAIVSENRLTTITDDLDLETAALFGCAITTGFGVVENNAKIRIGESVVVYGAGGVGLNIIQAASLVGAYPIIAVDLFDNRLDVARKMGATHTVNASTGIPAEELTKVIGSNGLDVFIDNTGRPEVIEYGFSLTGPTGRVILVGVPKKGANSNIYTLPLHFGKILVGSHGGEAHPEKDIPRYSSLIKSGKVRFDELVTKIYSLDDINEAISDMRSGKLAGRCLIKF